MERVAGAFKVQFSGIIDLGYGKSVLYKDLIDNRLFGLKSSDIIIYYFFFKDILAKTQSPANAVAAFLH
ncbi:hypothetical protein N7513_013110 [Penicillium frequentans]|nr:hypothetical protein N7513_013110 [Penicillium glabrum]